MWLLTNSSLTEPELHRYHIQASHWPKKRKTEKSFYSCSIRNKPQQGYFRLLFITCHVTKGCSHQPREHGSGRAMPRPSPRSSRVTHPSGDFHTSSLPSAEQQRSSLPADCIQPGRYPGYFPPAIATHAAHGAGCEQRGGEGRRPRTPKHNSCSWHFVTAFLYQPATG